MQKYSFSESDEVTVNCRGWIMQLYILKIHIYDYVLCTAINNAFPAIHMMPNIEQICSTAGVFSSCLL